MKHATFVICIDNSEFPVSLEMRKLYRMIPDAAAEKASQIRVVDESGEDYLYPASCFVEADLQGKALDAVGRVA
ncbi:MAG: hypothetical protein GWM87_03380 [Xanthomonadales bacterium]|nr:hypothetical protein [Xanthomonadales bacterium]NIX12081.1 hypothetical protein [Xanthomonadales bacterium]